MSSQASYFQINAETRTSTGKSEARKTRAAGKVPAILYRAHTPSQALSIAKEALDEVLRKNTNPNLVLSVTLDGSSHTCIVKEIQRHPVSRQVEHLDLQKVEAADRVVVSVPVVPVGRAVGTRAGGQQRLLVRAVPVKVSPLAIPATIEVDVTNLDIGQFIKVADLKASEGAEIVFRHNYNVLTVEGKRVKEQSAEAAAAAAAAAGKDKKKK